MMRDVGKWYAARRTVTVMVDVTEVVKHDPETARRSGTPPTPPKKQVPQEQEQRVFFRADEVRPDGMIAGKAILDDGQLHDLVISDSLLDELTEDERIRLRV